MRLLVAGGQLVNVGLDLLGLGLQFVGTHQLGHHQAQAHAALSLGAEHVFRDLGLVGVLDAALLEFSAGTFQQAGDFSLHAGVGQVQLSLGHQGVHHGLLVAGQQTELDFTLQVLLDVGAQAFHGAIGNTERLGQGIIHFGQVGSFDLLDGHQEVSGLASHILAVVLRRECQGEGLAFARLHATHGVFELLEHLAFAHQELEVFGLAAFKRLAIDLAFEIDRHAVAVLSSSIHGALGEAAALLAQDVDGLVDGGVRHFSRQLFDFGIRQIGNLDFWEHFENGIESDLAFRSAFLFGDAGLASNTQVGFVGCHGKGFTHLVVQHFVLHRVAVTLGHHVHGHLAGTETVHLDRAGQALEARVDFGLDQGDGHAQRNLALELLKGFNSNGHGYSSYECGSCWLQRSSAVFRKVSHGWCAGGDSNPHTIAGVRT
ncbi:hypothetical protein D3C71_1317190 [compost metagenome]